MIGLDLIALGMSTAALGVSIVALAKARRQVVGTGDLLRNLARAHEVSPAAAAFLAEVNRQGATLVRFGNHIMVAGASDEGELRRLKRAAVAGGGREGLRAAAPEGRAI